MLKARKSIACCSSLIRRYGILWKWITSVNLQAASTAEKEEALCVAIFHHIQSSLPKKKLDLHPPQYDAEKRSNCVSVINNQTAAATTAAALGN